MKLKQPAGGSRGASQAALRTALRPNSAETPGLNTDRAFRAKRLISELAFFKE
jgi:hypothetical protein